jgi:hypothetical protein
MARYYVNNHAQQNVDHEVHPGGKAVLFAVKWLLLLFPPLSHNITKRKPSLARQPPRPNPLMRSGYSEGSWRCSYGPLDARHKRGARPA